MISKPIYLILTMLISLSQYSSAQNTDNTKIIKVVDQNDTPIEGVYAKHGNSFWHSNEVGEIIIPSTSVNHQDSIYFSHLGYKKYNLLMADLLNDNSRVILEDNLFTLKEVIVSMPDLKQIVKDAIKKISDNYADPYATNLLFETEIAFNKLGTNNAEDDIEDSIDEELLRYKGFLELSMIDKKLCVSKEANPMEFFVSENLKNDVYFIKPYDFIKIISIKEHDVIKFFRRYKFQDYEYVSYQDKEAIKIYYKDKKRSGHLIIDKETLAILHINYTVEPMYPWTIGTIKGKGLVKTGINRYFIETEFIQKEDGKYIFDSGRENVELYRRHKGNSIKSVYNAYLKRSHINDLILDKPKKTNEIF